MDWNKLYNEVKRYGPNHVVQIPNPPIKTFAEWEGEPKTNPDTIMPDAFYRCISFTVEQIEFIAKSNHNEQNT